MAKSNGFTAAQMSAINLMIANAVATAVVAVQQQQQLTTSSAPAAPKTLAQAKASSFTMKIAKGVTAVNNAMGVGGNWAADKVSTIEVKTAPAIVSSTGYVCAKSAQAASATGNTLSSWATKLAEARARMEFAK